MFNCNVESHADSSRTLSSTHECGDDINCKQTTDCLYSTHIALAHNQCLLRLSAQLSPGIDQVSNEYGQLVHQVSNDQGVQPIM